LTDPESLEGALRWKKDVEEKAFLKNDNPIPCLLIGTKSDLSNKMNKTEKEMKEFCQEHGFFNWFETSSKSGENIEKAFDCLLNKINEIQANIKEEEMKKLNDKKNEIKKIIERNKLFVFEKKKLMEFEKKQLIESIKNENHSQFEEIISEINIDCLGKKVIHHFD
jgi:GTPase Era involved in 16S rRNA processing